MPITRKYSAYRSGVRLLETLISSLILLVGFIGLMGMQALAIKQSLATNQSTDSKFRGYASQLADQIIAEISADRANTASYANYSGGVTPCAHTGAASANPNVLAWLNTIQTVLPGAPANHQQIVFGADNFVTVTICWHIPGESQTRNFTKSTRING